MYVTAMKNFLFTFIYITRLTHLSAWLSRKRVGILCYHGITENRDRYPQDTYGQDVHSTIFAKHLDHLRRHYHVISLREYIRARYEGQPIKDYSVVLTFDDGYRNFLTAAAPRLAEAGMPASVFVVTDHLPEGNDADPPITWAPEDDERLLSWAELKKVEGRYVGVESHTCTHPLLSTLSPATAERELRDSRAAIGARLSSPAWAVAYPGGDYSAVVVAQARAAGYLVGLTIERGTNGVTTDPFTLRRIVIVSSDTEAAFAARVSGLTGHISAVCQWQGKLRAWVNKAVWSGRGGLKKGRASRERFGLRRG
jgi:peptidoglycan/xylan/chitin deacetylase (PgdA/CDA1 family)